MHGSVCEWVQDAWHDTYDDAPADGSAWTGGLDPRRAVIRGGCWSDHWRTGRSSVRGNESVDRRYNFVGFRVVRSL